MIQKISISEYLKRVDKMSPAEREEYAAKVKEWLRSQAPLLQRRACDAESRLQNAVLLSSGWNDAECRAWSEGAVLLSALVATDDTWLPDLIYTKSAKRTIKRMISALESACTKAAVTQQHTKQAAKEEPADKARKGTQAVATFRGSAQGNHDGEGKSSDVKGTPPTLNSVSVARPKHIDQYVHLLPEKTQEKAVMVRELLRDLDAARENARRLAESNGSAQQISGWAKKATAIDNKLKSIYKELDAEWEKLVKSGRVVVDAFGNASVMPDAEATGMVAAERNNDMTESRNNGEEEAAKEKRREYLKKWLRETRIKPSDERKVQWEQNYRELLSLGGEVTDSIRKAARRYMVDIDGITA